MDKHTVTATLVAERRRLLDELVLNRFGQEAIDKAKRVAAIVEELRSAARGERGGVA